jgi:F-type H+-transporting ATPase subunit b
LPAALVVAGATAAAGASEGGGSSLIEPQLGTMFWTLVTFLALTFVLGRWAWKPLIAALDEREQGIKERIDRARTDREEAERLLAEQRELLEQSRRERAEALAEGRRDAEKVREEILTEAKAQREKLLQQTDAQIQAGMRQARAELRGVAVDLAVRAAEKLLTRNLDDATHRKLIEEYLADLEGGSGGSKSLPS